jgi:hypothetical protein
MSRIRWITWSKFNRHYGLYLVNFGAAPTAEDKTHTTGQLFLLIAFISFGLHPGVLTETRQIAQYVVV